MMFSNYDIWLTNDPCECDRPLSDYEIAEQMDSKVWKMDSAAWGKAQSIYAEDEHGGLVFQFIPMDHHDWVTTSGHAYRVIGLDDEFGEDVLCSGWTDGALIDAIEDAENNY